MEFLNKKLLDEYRAVINSTNIFYESEKLKNKWNLICTVIDRLDSAVNWMNEHSNELKTEEDFIMFLVFASIIRDAIYALSDNIYDKKPKCIESKKWFSNICSYDRKPMFNENNCPTDDAFFDYLRSLGFAHPFKTDGRYKSRPFILQGEINYSPFVINTYNEIYIGKCVGIRIYSNMKKDIDLLIPLNSLKSYIEERYNMLANYTDWFKTEIVEQNNNWKKCKINRNQSIVEIFSDAIKISEERFKDVSYLKDTLEFINYNSNVDKNRCSIKIIKNIIIEKMNFISDCIDNLEYEELYEFLSFIYVWPKPYDHATYELEKIFCNLSEALDLDKIKRNNDYDFLQAKSFYKNYANKYVEIDFDKMTIKEIKLLVRTSCILGKIDEGIKI